MKKRRSNLVNKNWDELIEKFVEENGWYIPALHEKYLQEYICQDKVSTDG